MKGNGNTGIRVHSLAMLSIAVTTNIQANHFGCAFACEIHSRRSVYIIREELAESLIHQVYFISSQITVYLQLTKPSEISDGAVAAYLRKPKRQQIRQPLR